MRFNGNGLNECKPYIPVAATIQCAKENGIKIGTLPEDAATREEVTKMLKNFYDKFES